ncbi:MAG: hypothetical protein Q8R35_01605 [bacterium]|nr:hypothetical protein [bacterium]
MCVHDDRCTVGGGHSGPCTRISPGQQGGRLERALWRIVAAIVGIVVVAVAGVIALGYGILRGG